jgi:hypothetical protein
LAEELTQSGQEESVGPYNAAVDAAQNIDVAKHPKFKVKSCFHPFKTRFKMRVGKLISG